MTIDHELSLAINSLRQKYEILGEFKYSDFFQDNGEKILYDWVRSLHRESYTPNQRLVFLQDCADDYQYQDELGHATLTIQKALAEVDVSNCFAVVVSANKNISSELGMANDFVIKSPDRVDAIVIPGSYKEIGKDQKDTFCVLPWMHLYVGPEGDVLPCCAADQKLPLGHIDKHDLAEIYNNKNYQNLRRRMLDGKRTKECSHCWVKEDAGLPTMRQQFNQKYSHLIDQFKSQGEIAVLQPLYIDIRLNKLCNLKCRSCSEYYSSGIAQDIQEIYNVKMPVLNNQQRGKILKEILEFLPGVEKIYFAGGEPLLAPEHFAIISELLKLGKTDVEITYNTNFTQLTFKGNDFVEIWKNFSNVTIGASLDAIGVEAEYLRHGTHWPTIERNLIDLKSRSSPDLKFNVTSTVGFCNVESLIQLQRDWHQRGLLSIHDFKISQIIFDSHQSIQVLPQHHKQRIEKIITDHIAWVKNHQASTLAQRWQQVIDYMWNEDRSHLLPEFQRVTTTLDRRRNESFHAIFPQFSDLIPLNESK